jgi:hypothetical protein
LTSSKGKKELWFLAAREIRENVFFSFLFFSSPALVGAYEMLLLVVALLGLTLGKNLYTIQGVDDAKAICNDGSPYGFYIQTGDPSKWIFYYQGGAWCFDLYSCNERWKQQPLLMSSKGYGPNFYSVNGILAETEQENPLYFNYTKVYLPYCTSDDFSGNALNYTGMPWNFMGSHVTPAVLSKLKAEFQLKDDPSTTFVVSGSSAGGEALYPNIDAISDSIPHSNVLGINDSGWFLSSVPYYAHKCVDAGSCTEQEGIERGVKTWNSVLDQSCLASGMEPFKVIWHLSFLIDSFCFNPDLI